MTPQEIRDKGLMPEATDLFDDPMNSLLWVCAGFLREIAAQLSELNRTLERNRPEGEL